MAFLNSAGLERLWQHITTKLETKADISHSHNADDIASGMLGIDQGGTGASTASGALINLGMPSTAEIGQVVAVKNTDESGMPIQWEAVDLGHITIDEDGNAWFGTAEEIYKIPEGLPDYTDDDEGKILSVVDGIAAWTENKGGSSSGGGGIIVSETEPTDESVIFWVQI